MFLYKFHTKGFERERGVENPRYRCGIYPRHREFLYKFHAKGFARERGGYNINITLY
jgi:hypothetical protein